MHFRADLLMCEKEERWLTCSNTVGADGDICLMKFFQCEVYVSLKGTSQHIMHRGYNLKKHFS